MQNSAQIARFAVYLVASISFRRCYPVLVAIVLFASSAMAQETGDKSPQTPQPNIVLIMADDLGWTDLGCMGSEYYRTPNIDRLAEDGLTMRSFYVCQNCAPTRAALISGQYATRTGVYTVGSFNRGKAKDRRMVPPENLTKLPLDKLTIAKALQAAGYTTGMFGKWHLGTDAGYHPQRRGFDEAIVSNGRHFRIKTNPEQNVDPDVYLADYLTDQAVDFIERHSDHPFFLYVPHFAVHTPIQAKEELIQIYEDVRPVGGHNNATYAAMIHSVDESVGRIRKAIEEAGIAGQTLIIFMSDNGGLGGYRVPGTNQTKGITDNAPLRGGKGKLYEGGVRVPWIACWPGTIESSSKSDVPAAHVDLFPTFLELAQTSISPEYSLDGQSLVSLIKHPELPFDHGPIYWHFPGYLQSYIKEDIWRTTPVSTIRHGDYKLLEFFEDDRLELYNLKEDLGETRDIAADQPEKVQELHGLLKTWRQSTGALMATRKSETLEE